MTVIDLRTMRESATPPFSVVCLGNFDGVHRGHRALIRTAVEKKSELAERYPGLASGVCFFRTPPTDYLSSASVPHLMTFEQKLSVFSELGLDYAFVTDFEELRDNAPEEYVNHTLKEQCHCVFAVCGFNFRFGKKAAGTAEMLAELLDNAISVVQPVCLDGESISSSSIRQKIALGKMEDAASLLGRPYCIETKVLHGKALGRTLGIPTINQYFPDTLAVPKNGIYISKATVDGQEYPSVSNVGIRPSVDDGTQINCETHILGFDRDVYGQSVKVAFLTRLRDEMRFDDLTALRTQIEKDIEQTKAYFKEA